jgi:hypothetical protein
MKGDEGHKPRINSGGELRVGAEPRERPGQALLEAVGRVLPELRASRGDVGLADGRVVDRALDEDDLAARASSVLLILRTRLRYRLRSAAARGGSRPASPPTCTATDSRPGHRSSSCKEYTQSASLSADSRSRLSSTSRSLDEPMLDHHAEPCSSTCRPTRRQSSPATHRPSVRPLRSRTPPAQDLILAGTGRGGVKHGQEQCPGRVVPVDRVEEVAAGDHGPSNTRPAPSSDCAAAVPPAAGWTCPTSSTRRRASRSQSHVVGTGEALPVAAADADRGHDLGLLVYLVRVGEPARGRLSIRPEQPALQAVEHRVDGGLADGVAVRAQLPGELSRSEPVLALQRTQQRVPYSAHVRGHPCTSFACPLPSSVATHLSLSCLGSQRSASPSPTTSGTATDSRTADSRSAVVRLAARGQ